MTLFLAFLVIGTLVLAYQIGEYEEKHKNKDK
jgi:ABC-type cobalt transport system substrate-binding protein